MNVQKELCDVAGIGDVDYGTMCEVPNRPIIDEFARVTVNFDSISKREGMEFVFSQVEIFEHVDPGGELPQTYITIQGRLEG